MQVACDHRRAGCSQAKGPNPPCDHPLEDTSKPRAGTAVTDGVTFGSGLSYSGLGRCDGNGENRYDPKQGAERTVGGWAEHPANDYVEDEVGQVHR